MDTLSEISHANLQTNTTHQSTISNLKHETSRNRPKKSVPNIPLTGSWLEGVGPQCPETT